MRRSLILLLALATAPALVAQEDSVAVDTVVKAPAQEIPTMHHTIKVIPYALFHPTACYELGIYKGHALEFQIGGQPSLKKGSILDHVGVLFTGINYRYYFDRHTQFQFFLQAGIHLLSTQEDFQLFDYSNGWDIHTYTYHYSDHIIFPTYGFGIRVGDWHGLCAEFIWSMPLGRTWWSNENEDAFMSNAKTVFLCSNILSIRLGYTF